MMLFSIPIVLDNTPYDSIAQTPNATSVLQSKTDLSLLLIAHILECNRCMDCYHCSAIHHDN